MLEAEDGKSALEVIANKQSSRLTLILTDVVMKGMNGPELVLRLLDSHPAMKVDVYVGIYRENWS